ncbi:MAG: alpha-ribazole phosphatase [Bacteroidota bacterium]
MEVYLVRHTTPKIDKGICYGQTDLEPDQDLFEQELRKIRHQLPQDIEQVYSSPLVRCEQLAQQLSDEVSLDPRLMELDFGHWEHKRWSEIEASELSSWMEDFVNVQAGKGESYLDLHNRTCAFVKDLMVSGHQKVVVVTHAGNMRSFISYVLALPLENSFRIQLTYGTVVRITLGKNPFEHMLHLTPHF